MHAALPCGSPFSTASASASSSATCAHSTCEHAEYWRTQRRGAPPRRRAKACPCFAPGRKSPSSSPRACAYGAGSPGPSGQPRTRLHSRRRRRRPPTQAYARRGALSRPPPRRHRWPSGSVPARQGRSPGPYTRRSDPAAAAAPSRPPATRAAAQQCHAHADLGEFSAARTFSTSCGCSPTVSSTLAAMHRWPAHPANDATMSDDAISKSASRTATR